MSAHKIERTTTDRYVTCHIVKGGETGESVIHDAAFLEPRDGHEGVAMRVFVDGKRLDFRFAADDMRQALDYVEEIR